MSAIQTSLMLYDGMTGPLRNITTAMNVMINAFESAQRVSKNVIDTRSLQTAREQIAMADAAFDQMEQSINGAKRAQQQFNNTIQQGNTHAGNLLSTIRNAAIVAGTVKIAKQAINLSDTVTSTNARLSLIVDDGGSVAELEQKIMASAQRSRGFYLDTASAIASLGANAKNAFANNDEMIAFMEQVNKQFVIGGASAQGQAAAMLQLQQAMAAGALRGEELNSILENAPGIARAIESYLGIAEGSIKQYAEKVDITAEVVKNALFSVADETNRKLEQMPITFKDVWNDIRNQALEAFQPVLNQINQIANSEAMQSTIRSVVTAMQIAGTVLTAIVGSVVQVIGWLDQLGLIEPILWGIVAGLTAWCAIQVALKVATIAMTIAQNGLNLSFLACPITWIVIGVAALAAVIIYLANKVGGFQVLWNYTMAAMQVGWSVASNTVMSGIEWMVYGFMWLYDKATWCWDSISVAFMQAWDGMATVFEIVLGGFLSGMENLVNWVIDMLNGVIKAYDTVASIWGGQTNFQIEHTNFGQGYNRWATQQQVQRQNDITTRQILNEQNSYQRQSDLIDQANKAAATFNQGITDASNIWAAADQYAADYRAKQAAEKANEAANSQAYTAPPYDQLVQNTADTADNTSKMADALAMSATELKYLREIAERQAINKFTTAEIKVDMTNHNTISGEQDIDGIVAQLAEKVNEAMIVASEGVHT